MASFGSMAPLLVSPLPGQQSQRLVDVLAAAECPALTTRRARRREHSGAAHDPIVWQRALGVNVEDCDGNVFVDLTAGFGVASLGHGHPGVVQAVQGQAARLLHALGDVHPADVKVRLLQRLQELAPWPEARVILGAHGGDAVEAALKTAMLATGTPGVLAFEGGYHGLHYGPLAVCGYKPAFRQPFQQQLQPHVAWAPFPSADVECEVALAAVERACDAASARVGAVIIEPIQGRGGVHVPPPGFVRGLAQLCQRRGALLIVDEILTGLGRCGERFVSVADGVVPDLLCIGKSLGGGMPISACLGRPEVMAAWGDPAGEALHTATFFGHPLACAAALVAIEALEQPALGESTRQLGAWCINSLRALQLRHPRIVAVRGRGLLLGVELRDAATTLRVVRCLLEAGYITLPAGQRTEVLQLLPPLTISRELLQGFFQALNQALRDEH